MLLLAASVRAEGVYGTFQTQYQSLDENVTLVSGNGSLRSRALHQEFWLRTLDMHHQSYARPNLLFDSNLRYSDQTYLGRGDVTRTPQVRLPTSVPSLRARNM